MSIRALALAILAFLFEPPFAWAITFEEYGRATSDAWKRWHSSIESSPFDRAAQEIATRQLDSELDGLRRHQIEQITGIKFPSYFYLLPPDRKYDEWYNEWPTYDDDSVAPPKGIKIFEFRFGRLDAGFPRPDHAYAFLARGPLSTNVWTSDWTPVAGAPIGADDGVSLSIDLSKLENGIYYLSLSEHADISQSGDFSSPVGTANALETFAVGNFAPVPLPAPIFLLIAGIATVGLIRRL
jgi:hypothetical protein